MIDNKTHFNHNYSKYTFVVPPSWNEIFYSKEFIDHYVKRISNKPLKVLDMGCGMGTILSLTEKINKKANLYGIDISKTAISLANKSTNIKIKYGNVLKTDYPSNYFDVIVSSMVIEHVDDLQFVNEAHRILKPHGYLYITSVMRSKHAWYYLKDGQGNSILERSHLREYSDEKSFCRLFDNKFIKKHVWITPIYFPALDFIFRRAVYLVDQNILTKLVSIKAINSIRKLFKVKIPGYYAIECEFMKNDKFVRNEN